MSDFENSRVQDSFADHLDQSRELGHKMTLDNGEQQRGSPGSMGGTMQHETVHSAGMYLYSQKSFQQSQQDDRQIDMRQKTGADESMLSGIPGTVSPIAMVTAAGTAQPSLAGTQRLPGAIKQLQTSQPTMLHIQLENVDQEKKFQKQQPSAGAVDGQDAKSEQSTESDGTQRPPQAQPAAEYGQDVNAQGLRHTGANKGSRNSKNALQLINEPQLVTNPTSAKSSNQELPAKAEISDILIVKEIKESEKSRNMDANQQAVNIQHPTLGKNLELFVWGLNDNHQLGQAGQLESARGRSRSLSPMLASYKNVLIPRQVRDVDFDVQQIVCGSCHTLILSDEGVVYGLGNNSHGQLGQPVRQQPVVSRPTKIAFAGKVAQLACSATHSVIQTATGELYSCGLNSCGQLGLNPDMMNGQVVVDQFTQMDIQAQIDRFSCSDSATALLDTTNQRVFVYGTFQMQEQAKLPPMGELVLTPELENETVTDIKCGNQQMLMMTKSGKVFQVDESQNITQLNCLTHVSEIQAHGEYFAALTSLNRIHHWKYGHAEPFRMLELSQPSSSASQFHTLSIGDDYGHVVDQHCNLHGWGNNKNGELGTSDSYPRPRLSQIRIFNHEKQYMRCKQVFNGRSFALGLFESNVSPNGIGPSPTKATDNQRLRILMNDHLAAAGRESYKRPARAALPGLSSQFAALSQTQHLDIKAPATGDELNVAEYKEIQSSRVGLSRETGANRVEKDQHRHPQFAMNTHADGRPQPTQPAYPSQPSCDASCSALSRERRQAQYEATEIAIRKYRAQALNYKQNISRIKNNIQTSLEEETRQRHRSVSPYHNVLTTLGQETSGCEVQNYSPDKVVSKSGEAVKQMSAQQPKFDNQLGGQSMRPSQQYSFSQLEYDFDESRHQKGQQIGERVGHQVNNLGRQDFKKSAEIRGPERYERDSVDARGSTHTYNDKTTEQTIQLIEGSTIHYIQQESERTRNLNTEYQRQHQEMGRGQPALPGSSRTDTARLAKLNNGSQFRSLNLMDQPPTVTSIEALDHRQRAHEYNGADRFSRRGRSSEDGPNMNRRDPNSHNIGEANNLTRIIERSISATSSLIGRSQQSRSRSKREAARHLPGLDGPGKQSSCSPYSRTYQGPEHAYDQRQQMDASAFQAINSASETPDGSQTTLNGHIHLNRSNNQSRTETFDISASAICTSVNPSANQSRHEMHQRSYHHNSSMNQRADVYAHGGSQQNQQSKPSRVAAGRLSGEGATTRPPPADQKQQQHAGRVGRRPTGSASASYDAVLVKPALDQANFSANQQIPREKLNKYKRKLKKYFAKNAEQQTQIKLLADQVAHLERSNKRFLRADKQEASRQMKQVDALEHNLRLTEERHRRQHDQQQQEIKQLTSENIRMMAELQDRDDKHQLLDERLEFVDLEIENLGYQLKEQHELNAKQKRELAAAKYTQQEDSFDGQHQTHQESQLQNLQQQLQEQFEINRQKDEELQRSAREIQSLKKKYGHVREQSRQLETTVQDLQAQVSGLSQVNQEIAAQRDGQQYRESMAREEYRGVLFSKRGDPLANGSQAGAQPHTFQPTTVVASLEHFDDEPSNPRRSELEQPEEQSWGHPGHRRRQGAQVYSQDTFQQEADSQDREEFECEATSQVQHSMGAPSRALTGQSTHTSQLTQPTVATVKVRHDFGHDVVLKNQKSQQVGHSTRNGSVGAGQGYAKHHTVEHQESAQQHTGGVGSHNLSSLNVSQINQSSTSRLPGSAKKQLPGTGAGSTYGLSGPAAMYQQDSQFTSNIIDQRYVQYNGYSPRDDATFEDSRVLSQEVQDHQWQDGTHRVADGIASDGPADMLQQQPVSTRMTQMESSYGAYDKALREALSPSYPPAIHQGALPEEGFPNYAYVSKMYFNGQPSHYPRVATQEQEEQPTWIGQAQDANARGPGSHSQTRQEARGGAMSPIFSPQVAEPSLQSAGGASAFAPSAAGTVKRAMGQAQISLLQPEMLQHQHQQYYMPSADPKAASEGTRQPRPPAHLCSQRLPATSSGHHAGPASRAPQLATLPAGASLPPAGARTLSLGGSSQDQPAAPKFVELTPAQQSQVMALMRDRPRSGSHSGGQPVAPAGEELNNFLKKQAWAPLLPARTPNQVPSAQLATMPNMTALSVATPDLNATAASAVDHAVRHRPAESILEPAQIVRVEVAAADAWKQSEPSVNQSRAEAKAVDTSVVSYKDSILSKFQRRTNDKIMDRMKARDLVDPVVSRSIDGSLQRNCEPQADAVQGQDSGAATQTIDKEHSLGRSTSPCIGRAASIEERKSLAQARESFEHGTSDPPAASKKSPAPLPHRPQDFGELRSSARLALQRERKAADRERVEEYRERSKDWLKRRGRQPEQDCPEAKNVAATYKEAFRNLSMELKKRISTTGKSPYSSIGSLKEPDDFAKIYTVKANDEEA